MVVANRLSKNISGKQLSQSQEESRAADFLTPSSQTNHLSTSNTFIEENFYQELRKLPTTIISFQYNPDEFLTFKVYEASLGRIMRAGTETVGLQCRIGGKTYLFSREHLDTMSNSECRELLNHLEISDSELF